MPQPTKDLTTLLRQIKARPEMYVGGATPLRDLENLITGYELALANHEITETGQGFNRRFSTFLRETQAWSLNRGWARAFEEHFEKRELLPAFFRQTDLFLAADHSTQPSSQHSKEAT